MSSAAQSLAAELAVLEPQALERVIAGLTRRELQALWYRWEFWARAQQTAPSGEWDTWLLCAGLGFGKTRVGAEWIRREAESGRSGPIALVGRTMAEAAEILGVSSRTLSRLLKRAPLATQYRARAERSSA